MEFVLSTILLADRKAMSLNFTGFCQGPRNVDLRTPPGQECSNGSLLCVCRGYPGISLLQHYFSHSRILGGNLEFASNKKILGGGAEPFARSGCLAHHNIIPAPLTHDFVPLNLDFD